VCGGAYEKHHHGEDAKLCLKKRKPAFIRSNPAESSTW